jgi:hypothetical protein
MKNIGYPISGNSDPPSKAHLSNSFKVSVLPKQALANGIRHYLWFLSPVLAVEVHCVISSEYR